MPRMLTMIKPPSEILQERATPLVLLVLFLIANLAKLLAFRHALAAGGMNLPNLVFTTAVLGSLIVLTWPILLGTIKGLFFWPVYALQATYIFANLAYFAFYGTYLTISSAFALFSEAAGVAGAGGVPLRVATIFVTLADLPLAIAAFILRTRATQTLRHAPRPARLMAVGVVILGLCGAVAFRAVDTPFRYTIGRAVFRPNVAVNAFGLLPYQIGSYFQNERGLKSLVAAMEPKGPTRSFAGKSGRANIVVIQVESLGSDALEARIDGKPIMPYLERLAKECIYYPYTLVYHKGGGTSDTEVAVVSATETIANYPAANLPLDYHNSFVKSLKTAGYTSIIYHGNGASYFNRDKAFPAMGFDRYESLETMGIPSSGWGAPDRDVFALVERSMQKQRSPFFCYIITMSSHGPYTNVPRYYQPPFAQGTFSDIEYRYNTSMSYVDAELERAVSAFRAAGAQYIIIFGDHPDYYVEGADRSRERSVAMVNGSRMKFTPLFIITPDGIACRADSKVASLLDVGPTILSASGARSSIITWGEDLLTPGGPSGPVVFGGREYDRRALFSSVAAVSGKALAP